MAIEFQDNSQAVLEAIDSALNKFLEEACGEWESQTKQNTRVDSSQTKDSWSHRVENYEGIVGSPMQNAIWEELGTGEYALGGNGRKTPWRYKDNKGWHTTRGKRPSRAFYKAYLTVRGSIQKQAAEVFGARIGFR